MRRDVRDKMMACFGLAPYRCRACRNRFFRVPVGSSNGLPSPADDLLRSAHQVVPPEPFVRVPPPLNGPVADHPLSDVPVAYSILIVGRDPAIRKLLCKLLAHPGYHTHQLADIAQVSSELRTRKVDLLIADLDEPEQQRLETVATLQSEYPNLRVIALSGLQVSGVPGSIILTKPFHRELLLESVQSSLVDAADSRLSAASTHA